MRIALLHPYSWPDVRRGGERYLHDLAQWLQNRGHHVDVVTGPTTSREADGPGVIRLPLLRSERLARSGITPLDTFGIAALRHLARHRYDVVHSLVPSAGLAAALALQPSVYTVLGHPSPTNPPARAWSRALFTAAVRKVRVPTALSRSAADGVEGLTGRLPTVLTPGVRTEEFVPKEHAPTGPVSILFNGFAEDPRKRLHVLMAAMPDVLESLPDARVHLGGGGDPTPALDRLESGIRRAVEPSLDDLGPGVLADVPVRYRQATISVLPSVDEAFGLVLVESLACGTPVVCSRSGGMPEIVTPAVGRLATPDDPRALAIAILSGVKLARESGSSAVCASHAKRWDWALVGPMHELIYARAKG